MPNDRAPLVSIIVPTYNCEGYIKQALDSILMQECDFSYEILIGDDASTDGTPQILLDYAARHECIKLFLRETNLGAAKNCIELLKTARGKYLATLEGDDIWTSKNKLRAQIHFLENNPEFVGCSHFCTIINANGKRTPRQKIRFIKYRKNFTLDTFGGYYLPGQPSSLVKRNVYAIHPEYFDMLELYSHRNISDRFSLMMFLCCGNFGLIPKSMSAYRIRENSITATHVHSVKNEFGMLCDLEDCYKLITGRRTQFGLSRRQRCASAVIPRIAGKDVATATIKEIYKTTDNKFFMLLCLPFGIIRAVSNKLFCIR